MKLSFVPFDLVFKHAFNVSGYSRTTTPIVIIRLEHDGVVGFGEATMPPYLGESQESVMRFLDNIDLSKFSGPSDIEAILDLVDNIETGNNAAKAGFDIALHDLHGKIRNKNVSELYAVDRSSPFSSFTIGIDTPEKMVEKVREAMDAGFRVLKIKLGCDQDREIMDRILNVWHGPYSIDANQGWKDKEEALEFIHYLKQEGALFIEQPFQKNDLKNSAWLTERSPLPIIADESVKRLEDLDAYGDCFHGINVKLMKSTGIREAFAMISKARARNMKVVTGCMAESSCAVTAMANLSPLADWVDLDGPFLITNDPFRGVNLSEGKLILPDLPGTSATPYQKFLDSALFREAKLVC
jgi:L-alanine-DL-glutamate epimerase-like enolase superfamily enzyme